MKRPKKSEKPKKKEEASEISEVLYGTPVLTDLAYKATDVLGEGERATDVLDHVATDVLPKGMQGTDVLDKVTDVLDRSTDVLDNATNVLDKETDVLDKSTDVLNKSTDILDTKTDVLNKTKPKGISEELFEDFGEGTDTYEEDDDTNEDTTDVLAVEDDEATEVLCGDHNEPPVEEPDMNEEQPLPAIFDVQDMATVVHTKDKIGN